MRFLSVKTDSGNRLALDFETHLRLTPFPDLVAALDAYNGDVTALADITTNEVIEHEKALITKPLLRPSKIICLGLNFLNHIKEMGHEVPKYPTLFAKFANTLAGPYDDLTHPGISDQMDWEVELAVVIGTPARNVTSGQALDHVAGYTVANDISMRDFQYRTIEFLQGKIFEATTPVGPVVVTRDEVDDARDLEMHLFVDGELRQHGNTSDMVFSVAETISYISAITTLEPGDLILMGTPPGVGAHMTPPTFLKPDQVVEASIAGIGSLRNRIINR
jgi:acylpyruvate hydrolase